MNFNKCQRSNNREKSTYAQHGGINLKNIKENIKSSTRRNLGDKIGFRLCIWTNKARRENKKSVHIYRYRCRTQRIIPILEKNYRLADIPTLLQKKIDKILENKHPAWLDDMIIATKDI